MESITLPTAPDYPEMVRDLISRHLLRADETYSLPIDVETLVDSLGYSLYRMERVYSPNPNFNGAISHEDNHLVVMQDTPRTERFALARLVYRLANPNTNENFEWDNVRTAEDETRQAESGRFARELLMPGQTLRCYWAKGWSIKKIARTLDVSEDMLIGQLVYNKLT